MKTSGCFRIGAVFCGLLLIIVAVVVLRSSDNLSAKAHSVDLEYLKAVNSVAPITHERV